MTPTEAQAIARTLVTARTDDALFEQLLSETVENLLSRTFTFSREDSEATAGALAALVVALVDVASVSLSAADESVGARRGTARSRLFARLAGAPGGGGST